MLGENLNPNTNKQVPAVQCLPAGQPLAQHTRPREANGKFTFTSPEDKKRSRKAAQANYAQKNVQVKIHKALKSNFFEALGDLAIKEGKNGKPGTQMTMTEALVFLMGYVRLDDGTCFEVDPANNYEITKVRDSRTFFWHGRALFFCISRQNMGGVNLAKYGMILRTSPQLFFQR
jgi:hypothetical protein